MLALEHVVVADAETYPATSTGGGTTAANAGGDTDSSGSGGIYEATEDAALPIASDSASYWKVVCEGAKGDSYTLYAQHVVMATGGTQGWPSLLSTALQKKVVLSDTFLTRAGMAAAAVKLCRMKPECGRVVVIGGSHSAWSAVWVCLHAIEAEAARLRAARAEQAAVSCASPTAAAAAVVPSSPKSAIRPSTVSGTSTGSGVGSRRPMASTRCPAHGEGGGGGCGGSGGAGGSSGSSGAAVGGVFGAAGISLLHRSSIRVFYETKKEADADEYNHAGNVAKSTGQVLYR